jgi:hypothetical protein
MINFHYALNREDYTLDNALFWGNCELHLQKAKESSDCDRFVHGLIFLLEFLPIIGQIASLFEKFIVTNYSAPNQHSVEWSNKNISIETDSDPKFSEWILEQAGKGIPIAANPLLAPPPVTSIQDQFEFFRSLPGCQLFGEEQEQVEIALNGVRAGEGDVFSPWKLYISATPENAGLVLLAVRGALIRCQAHFKCIKNEQLLRELNPPFSEGGRFKQGSFITICAATDEQVQFLASELNGSLQDAIKEGIIPENATGAAIHRTGRPIGKTGYLSSKNDLNGTPATGVDLIDGSNVPVVEPQPDIFEGDWGKVQWNTATRCFEPIV